MDAEPASSISPISYRDIQGIAVREVCAERRLKPGYSNVEPTEGTEVTYCHGPAFIQTI